jgi:hypothetical protein
MQKKLSLLVAGPLALALIGAAIAHLKRIARQVKAVDDAGARAQAGESLQLLAPSARLRAQGIS